MNYSNTLVPKNFCEQFSSQAKVSGKILILVTNFISVDKHKQGHLLYTNILMFPKIIKQIKFINWGNTLLKYVISSIHVTAFSIVEIQCVSILIAQTVACF